ncbi:MAG: pectate lyase [Prevotella sp.]|nr:pectate lyase [Prevotella sp.]
MRNILYAIAFMAGINTMPSLAQGTDNSVKRDVTKTQMSVKTTDNNVRYYNIDAVENVSFDADKTIIMPYGATTGDVYDRTVSEISFVKKQEQTENGIIDNAAGHVVVTQAKGWQECLYVEWTPFAGASSYNVYIKGGQHSDFTRIDRELVRDYGAYGRADVPGLKAGEGYEVKVVPVGESGEMTDAATKAYGIKVVNYSREGFAHLNYSGVGAYNDDGTLKNGAKVLYVTAKNAKTVTTEVLVDKKLETRTGIQDIIDAYQKGTDTTPLAIRIIGKVTKDDLDKISSSAEGLQVKGRNEYSLMPITIEGIGEDATISGFGILVRNCKGLEMRNFAIMLCMDDCISLDTGNSNIWLHNIDLFYGQTGGDADQAKGDGTIDLKGGTKYVTISGNRYWDCGKSSLCGMGGDEANYITYQNNWFDHSDSRHPRIRCMSVHIWNNYYDGVAKYGVGATTGASAFVEANYFRNCNKPMLISMQGSDINNSEHKGTFSSEDGGIIKSYANVFAEKSSNFKYVTWQQDNVEFDAYEASERNETVPSEVKAKKGGTGYDNFDTDASLMYEYTPANAIDVPANVTGYYGAGRLNHGDFAWDFTGKDADYSVDSTLKTALQNYKSKFVKIFGDEEDNTGSGDSGSGDSGSGDSGSGDSGSGDSGSGDSGNTGEPVGEITCNFSGKTPSNSFFNISGNYSDSKGTATVNGVEYKVCLKIESSTSITFTTTVKMKMTLYFGSGDSKVNIKVDGTKVSGDTNTKTLTTELEAGSHTLTKADTCNLFYILLEPAE